MIPGTSGFLQSDFEIVTQPTKTYRMDMENQQIRGYADSLEAMKQAIYKIVNTERYQYIMYSWNYGIELLDLFGEPISYVIPEVKRRIREALVWDDRINSVDNFETNLPEKGVLYISFTAHTIFGDVQAERTVNF